MTDLPAGVRILHVLSGLGPTNGQYNEHCLPLMHERRITICSLTPPLVEPPPQIRLFAGAGGVRGAWTAMRHALRGNEYDILHAHAPVSGAALMAGVLTSRQHARARCVFTMQNSYQNYRRRNQLLLLAIFAFFPRIVLCSKAVLESLPPALSRLGRGKMTVVPNAVDTDRVRAVVGERTPDEHDGLTVVSVARLIDIKDPHVVLQAFLRMREPGDRLLFVGEGPLRAGLERAVEQEDASDAVTFTGLAPRDDVYRYVRDADVYVSASHGEGLPVAVLEAMACGAPVVLSDIPPHREVAEALPAVPLVPVGDVEAFARELTRLRAMAPEERARVGESCRALVEERYGIPAMHEALAVVYHEVLGDHPVETGVTT